MFGLGKKAKQRKKTEAFCQSSMAVQSMVLHQSMKSLNLDRSEFDLMEVTFFSVSICIAIAKNRGSGDETQAIAIKGGVKCAIASAQENGTPIDNELQARTFERLNFYGEIVDEIFQGEKTADMEMIIRMYSKIVKNPDNVPPVINLLPLWATIFPITVEEIDKRI